MHINYTAVEIRKGVQSVELQQGLRKYATCCFKVKLLLKSPLLGQNFGLCAAAGEEDPLGQFVEELDGSSRQLCQTPDGRCMNLLEIQHSKHQNDHKQI